MSSLPLSPSVPSRGGYDPDTFVEAPADRFMCPVCLQVLCTPVSVCKEGHLLCCSCFDALPLHPQLGNRICPICRSPCIDPHRQRVVEDLIMDFIVYCPFHHKNTSKSTCTWTGTLSQQHTHLVNTCPVLHQSPPQPLRQQQQHPQQDMKTIDVPGGPSITLPSSSSSSSSDEKNEQKDDDDGGGGNTHPHTRSKNQRKRAKIKAERERLSHTLPGHIYVWVHLNVWTSDTPIDSLDKRLAIPATETDTIRDIKQKIFQSNLNDPARQQLYLQSPLEATRTETTPTPYTHETELSDDTRINTLGLVSCHGTRCNGTQIAFHDACLQPRQGQALRMITRRTADGYQPCSAPDPFICRYNHS